MAARTKAPVLESIPTEGAEVGAADTPTDSPLLPPPNPIEIGILSDWVRYSKMSHIRLQQASSAFAAPLYDFISVIEDVLQAMGET